MCLCFAKRTGANNAKRKSSQGKWETVFFCPQETKSPHSVGARPKKREREKKIEEKMSMVTVVAPSQSNRKTSSYFRHKKLD